MYDRNVAEQTTTALRTLLGAILLGALIPIVLSTHTLPSLMPFFIITGIILIAVILIQEVKQYERGIVLTMGMYTSTRNPGWQIIIPIFQRMTKVDMRIAVIDVPDQDAITRDNISVNVNAVVYYHVVNAETAILKIENFRHAISQLAQTTMRDVVGEMELDGLLANRDDVSKKIRDIVDQASDPWGVKVTSVDIKHVELPADMKRTIAKQAEAEREKRAVIINSEGEVIASENMAKAAAMLSSQPGALHLRTLQSLNDISSDQSNTIVFTIPLEIMQAMTGFFEKK